MTNPVTLRLVDRATVDAEVLFDFNDDLRWPDHDSFTIGAPSLLGAPGGVGADYDYRQIAWTQVIDASNQTAMRLQQELGRVLQRSEFYLLMQLSPATPRFWFRCVRSSPGDVSLATVDMDRDRNLWMVNVSLVAHAHALGEKVTLPAVTIGNDPQVGGGLVALLNNIKGDAPAPLDIELAPGSSAYIRPVLSVMPLHGTTWPYPNRRPVYWQTESMSAVNGATITSRTDVSNGQGVDFTCGANDTAYVRKVQGFVRPPFAGRWRLFARVVTRSVQLAPGVLIVPGMQLRGAGPACIDPRTSTTVTAAGGHIVDLGVFAFPRGNMPHARPYKIASALIGVDARLNPSASAQVRQVAAATPYVTIDYIVGIPVDLPLDQGHPCTLLNFTDSEANPGTVTLRVNSEASRVEMIDGTGQHIAATPSSSYGGYPKVFPGAQNVVHLLTRREIAAGGAGDSIATSTTLTWSYRPRHLYFADA